MLYTYLHNKVKDPKKAESLHFIILILGSYFSWKFVSFILENTLPKFWIDFQNLVATLIISLSVFVSKIILHSPIQYWGRNIIIPSKPGIYVADHCLGIPAMVVFSLFILFFSGSKKHKIWFIPLGMIGVLLINAVRILALILLMSASTQAFWDFNHKYLFLGLTYGFIFLMIKFWMDKFAETH